MPIPVDTLKIPDAMPLTKVTPLTSDIEPVPAEQLEQLLALQRSTLQQIAQGANTDLILDTLCRQSEALLPDAVASIMLLNRDE